MAARTRLQVGVEEEYQLVSLETGQLAPLQEQVLAIAWEEAGEHVYPELQLSQVEAITPICDTLADVRAELLRLRRTLNEAARAHEGAILAAGTHPYSRWEAQEITPQDRYRGIEAEYRQLAREQLVFGYHVHVGVEDRDAAVGVMNRARLWLAPLLALSASSPYWMGVDTGYSSYRTITYSRFQFTGPPGIFASREEYEEVLRALVQTDCVEDVSKIYWDVRIPERVPTVEFRVADVSTSVDGAVMLAGLVRALVARSLEEAARGAPFATARHELVRAAHWRAARYGLEGTLIDLTQERSVPAHELVRTLLGGLRPQLEEAGDWEEVSELVERTLRDGNSAARQRRAFARRGSLEDVVQMLLEETARS